jgi:membrane protease YdiL (CAAX protease family)
MTDWLAAPFGSPEPKFRGAEWRRLGRFLAIGAGIFVIAVIAAGFFPFSWPDAIRRSAHPMIFVPLAVALTVRTLRKDAMELPGADLFDPWPVGRTSFQWLVFGAALSGIVAVLFVLAFQLRWAPNERSTGANVALMIWAIVLTAAAEEIAFRGYALWRLTRLIGFWQAQAIIAILFALSHATLGGYSLVPALVGTMIGSVLYGVAFARTRTIAAPIALHSGWNIVQHLLLSPLSPTATPFVPIYPHSPTGREYIVMLAIVGTVMIAATTGLLIVGSPRRPADLVVPDAPSQQRP